MASKQSLDRRQEYLFAEDTLSEVKSTLTNNEIGLHGTMPAAFDRDTMAEEFQNLKDADLQAIGYRNHYLSFDYQKSFALLEQEGFLYDSTLGFWEHIGYRAGISFPFHPII